jgi:PAS domain S-box-containing protein
MSPVSQDRRQQILRYLLAVGVTAAAVVVTRFIQPLVAPSVTPPFILAVAVAALYGGRGPGALATLLGVAALSHWFFPPFRLGTSADLARQVMFLVVAAVTTWIAGTVNRHRWAAVREAGEKERLRQVAEEAAKALHRREAELADFFEHASTPLHWVTEDGTIVRANRAELDMLGYERDEYFGHRIAEFHVDRPVIDDILARLSAGQMIHQYPARLRCKDGQVKDVLIDSSAYRADGRFVHTRCFTRDVTVEKQAQEAMARFAAIVSSSSDAIIGKTLDGVITSWNAAAMRIFGYTQAEMVGQSVFKLIPEELQASERDILARLRLGEVVEFSETERVRKDGQRIWISLSVSPIRDGSGTIIGAASIKRDVTERKVVEEQLRDAQRLRAVGQLAGGIAHEANNQMSVVLGGTQFLLRRTDLPPAAREDVELIRQAAERTASITRQLLAFSRRQSLQLQTLRLNGVVQSIEPVLRRSLTEAHRLAVRLGPCEGLVQADPRQLEQVLLNLTLNARDAMPDGGELTVTTSDVTLSGDRSRGGPAQPPAGRYAALTVEDTGHGMDPATQQRAFEPFYTTKGVGQGTGLGLSVVHGIISQTGGYIQVESEPGKGAKFTLYFPVVPAGGVTDVAEIGEAPLPAHDRVALVVEDDPFVRRMAARGLIEAGYVALEAEHGRAALELIRNHTGRLDVVVTDIGMPEMDGYELARRLQEERPGLPIVFMSGYGDVDPVRPLLQKPFAPDVLVRKVGEALGQ